MVIAIDGPAGAGKSTAARAVATKLGFAHLDTGAMYRAVALVGLERGIAPLEAARSITIEPGPPITVDGEAPGERLRTAEVSAAASAVASDPEIRRILVERQREILASGDWVVEGRDICSVVAPDAEVRIWLVADEVERARRRAAESGLSVDEVLEAQRARDAADTGHGRSTLSSPEGAVALDTTGLDVEGVVDRICELAEGHRQQA